MRKIIALIGIIGIAVLVGWAYQANNKNGPAGKISSFEDCVAAGYPVMESYPPRCSTPDGKSFTQDIGNELENSDHIVVEKPRPNERIASPLRVTGKARGTWYFEANFSAEIVDEENKSHGTAVVQAEGEWMTEEFVPFTTEIIFQQPTTQKGKLILRNANPSGLSENAKELIIPVEFTLSAPES